MDKLEKVREYAITYRDKAKVNAQNAQEENDYNSYLQFTQAVADYERILSFIDTMQEEPKSFDEAIQEGDDVRYNEDLGCRVNLSQLKRVAKKEATGKLKECIDNITDESLAKARKQLQEELVNGGLDLGCGVIWKDEESVSEDLEEAIRKYEQRLEKENPATEAYDFASAIRFGANWQKQQMEAYRIEHCKSLTNEQAELEDNFVSSHVEKNNRIPTFIDAIEYGIEYGKQQIMAKAIDVEVKVDAGGYPYVERTIELYDYDREIPLAKKGDKVKVIVIKQE